jgi:hypothetical protein
MSKSTKMMKRTRKTVRSAARFRSLVSAAPVVTAATLILPGLAKAISVTDWNGNAGDSLWTDPGNWSPSAPTTGYAATFNGSGNGETNISLGGSSQDLQALVFTVSPSAYTIGTTVGDALNFDSAGSISVTSGVTTGQTIDANIVDNGSLTIDDAAASTLLALDGNISGAGTITFLTATGSNGGSILFNASNTFNGGTTINSAASTTILIGNNNAFGTGTITMDNTSNSPLEAYGSNITLSNPVTLTYGFTVADAATPYGLTFTGPIAFQAAGRTLTFNNFGQVATLGSSTSPSTITLPTFASGSTGTININSLSGTGGPATLVLNDAIQDPGAGSVTVAYGPSGNGSLTPGNVIINGASTYKGPTWFNNQTSTFAGQETVGVGVSSVGSPGAITSGPFGQGTVTFNDKAAPPILEPLSTVANAPVTIANAISLPYGFFTTSAATTGTGPSVDPAGTTHSLIFTGPINDQATVITNNLAAGVGLYLGGSPTTASTLTVSSTNSATFQGQQAAAGTGTTYIYDQITGPGSIVIKEGGTVNFLNNSNNFTGTVSVIGSGTLGSGGTLAGTGNVSGPLAVSSTSASYQGGIIAPGVSGSPGTFSVTSLTLDPLGRYVFQYNGTSGTAGGGVNSLITGSGTLDLSNLSSSAPFDLNLTSVVAGSGATTYTLANFVGGIFSGGVQYAGGTDLTTLFTFSGTAPFTPDVQVVTNPDESQSLDLVDLAATPEPTSLALLSLAGLLTLRRRRSTNTTVLHRECK